MRSTTTCLVLVLLCSLIISCSEPKPAIDTPTALSQILQNSILPAVTGFESAANTLNHSAHAFCEQPDLAKLNNAQQQWIHLYEQWFKLAIYHFGPLKDDLVFPKYTFIDGLRLRGINYLAIVREDIKTDLEGHHELTKTHYANKTFQKLGLLPLEALLFETPNSKPNESEFKTEHQAILNRYIQLPRLCSILKHTADKLQEDAAYVSRGWQTNYKNTANGYSTLFTSEELDDGMPPSTQLLVSIQEYVRYMVQRNISTIASPVAHKAWEGINASINEIDELLQGTNNTSVSLFDVMTAKGSKDLVHQLQEKLTNLQQRINNQDSKGLNKDLIALEAYFRTEIPEALGIDLGINFSDGD